LWKTTIHSASGRAQEHGKYIYFTWRDDLGDIWVMDVN